MLLHVAGASEQGFSTISVIFCDADVLVFLIYFTAHLPQKLYMQSGTFKEPNYAAIQNIQIAEDMGSDLLGFHAATGCDTTRYKLSGFGKKSAWKIF